MNKHAIKTGNWHVKGLFITHSSSRYQIGTNYLEELNEMGLDEFMELQQGALDRYREG